MTRILRFRRDSVKGSPGSAGHPFFRGEEWHEATYATIWYAIKATGKFLFKIIYLLGAATLLPFAYLILAIDLLRDRARLF